MFLDMQCYFKAQSSPQYTLNPSELIKEIKMIRFKKQF